MHRIDDQSATDVLPTPEPDGPKKNGFFQASTIVRRDIMNAIQEEICGVIETAGIALDKAQLNQLYSALVLLGLDDASTLFKGIVELATNTETQAGTDATRAVTPASLQSKVATDIARGLVELATNTETQAGTDAARAVTPGSLQSKVATDTAKGIVELATNAETQAGTDATRAVTPAGLIATITKAFIDALGINATTLLGAAPSDTQSTNTIVKRTAAGEVKASHFHTTANFTTLPATSVMIETGSDGFIRRQTPQQFIDNYEILKTGNIPAKVYTGVVDGVNSVLLSGPSGWSVVRQGVGLYTIVHNLDLPVNNNSMIIQAIATGVIGAHVVVNNTGHQDDFWLQVYRMSDWTAADYKVNFIAIDVNP